MQLPLLITPIIAHKPIRWMLLLHCFREVWRQTPEAPPSWPHCFTVKKFKRTHWKLSLTLAGHMSDNKELLTKRELLRTVWSLQRKDFVIDAEEWELMMMLFIWRRLWKSINDVKNIFTTWRHVTISSRSSAEVTWFHVRQHVISYQLQHNRTV